MDKSRIALGVISFAALGAILGYVLASAYLTFRWFGVGADIDFLMLARGYNDLRVTHPNDMRIVNLITGICTGAGVLLSAVLMNDALTKFGETHWQTLSEMKRSGFFGKPGHGFILGKMGSPKSGKPLIMSKVFPHALIVAPTGRGKTTGFVIPNLLTYQGSAVVLDVKGENFDATSRHRAAQGDKVFRFAPTDWRDGRSHRYNPLLRIAGLENVDRQQMELQLLASLFLQADDRVQGLLDGGIDLFVAAGLLAFERKRPTLGEIYRITASGGDKQKEYRRRADEAQNPAAKLIFMRMASTNNDTLTSYLIEPKSTHWLIPAWLMPGLGRVGDTTLPVTWGRRVKLILLQTLPMKANGSHFASWLIRFVRKGRIRRWYWMPGALRLNGSLPITACSHSPVPPIYYVSSSSPLPRPPSTGWLN